MEYQKIIHLFNNTQNQPTKFTAKNGAEVNDGSYGVYSTCSQIRFKTSMLRSSLCNFSDAHILAKGTITVLNTGTAAAPYDRNKNVIFKSCTPFTDCISEVNNKEIDHVKDIDVVSPMYNLITYSDNYLKTFGSLWPYYKNKAFIDNNGAIIDVFDDHDKASIKYKQK